MAHPRLLRAGLLIKHVDGMSAGRDELKIATSYHRSQQGMSKGEQKPYKFRTRVKIPILQRHCFDFGSLNFLH